MSLATRLLTLRWLGIWTTPALLGLDYGLSRANLTVTGLSPWVGSLDDVTLAVTGQFGVHLIELEYVWLSWDGHDLACWTYYWTLP